MKKQGEGESPAEELFQLKIYFLKIDTATTTFFLLKQFTGNTIINKNTCSSWAPKITIKLNQLGDHSNYNNENVKSQERGRTNIFI